jgi:hypothetical protein
MVTDRVRWKWLHLNCLPVSGCALGGMWCGDSWGMDEKVLPARLSLDFLPEGRAVCGARVMRDGELEDGGSLEGEFRASVSGRDMVGLTRFVGANWFDRCRSELL